MWPPKKHEDLFRYRVDLNDGYTSLIERIMLWLGIACMLVATISEVIQGIQALRQMLS